MAIATPRSVVQQMGKKGAKVARSKSVAKSSVSTRHAKVSGTGRRYSSHPRKQGQ